MDTSDYTSSAAARTIRRWGPRLALALVVPLLLLLTLEGLLRLLPVGYPTDFFVPVRGQKAYMGNPRFGWRFFPREQSRAPIPLWLPAQKAPGVTRIFVLGGSAAQGIPDPAYSFSRILEVMLAAAWPDRRFEVVNTAMTAMNSHAVLPIARDCSRHAPDLFVVLMGNNEVVGPYGAGRGNAASLGAIRLGLALKTTRVGQLLQAAGERVATARRTTTEWRGMEMFQREPVAADSPAAARSYRHFAANLSALSAVVAASGAQAVFCTVPVNLRDCAPFASRHREGLDAAAAAAWDEAFARAERHLAAGETEDALAAYGQAAAIDDRYADLQYRVATCHYKLGNVSGALTHFLLARDLDVLRFRADSTINALIRRAAEAAGGNVRLADAEAAFAAPSEPDYGLPGSAYFHEHAHLTFSGNYRLAQLVFEQIRHWLPGGPVVALPDRAACARRLALTPADENVIASRIWEMTGRPPFTLQITHLAWRNRFYREMRALRAQSPRETMPAARALYREAVAARPDDLLLRANYGHLLHEAGAFDAAAAQWEWILERLPDYADAHVELGALRLAQGRAGDAAELFARALELAASPAEYHNRIGEVFAARGQLGEATAHFARGLALQPGHATMRNNLGAMYFRQQQHAAALNAFEETVARHADDPVARDNLGVACLAQGDLDRAVRHLSEAVRLAPFNIMIRDHFAVALARRGDLAAAVAQIDAALAIEPDAEALRHRRAELIDGPAAGAHDHDHAGHDHPAQAPGGEGGAPAP